MNRFTELFVMYLGLFFIKFLYALSFYLYLFFSKFFLMLLNLQVLLLDLLLFLFSLFTFWASIHPPKCQVLKDIANFQNPFPVGRVVPYCIKPSHNEILLREEFFVCLRFESVNNLSFFAEILLTFNGFGVARADKTEVIFTFFAVIEAILRVDFFLADVTWHTS